MELGILKTIKKVHRRIYFIIIYLLGFIVYFNPLRALIGLSFHNHLYSHFLFIPAASIFLVVINRKRIFAEIGYSPAVGLSVIAAGLVSYAAGILWNRQLSQNDFLFFCMIGFVTWTIGSFIAFCGKRAFQKALLPTLFLIFMIPIPFILLDPIIRMLTILCQILISDYHLIPENIFDGNDQLNRDRYIILNTKNSLI